MRDPRQIAAQVVGRVEWQTAVSGFCACPGQARHRSPTGRKDCRVNVDGVPTVYCFHASCGGAVAEANLRLRRELGAGSWGLRLPGGPVLRNGDILQRDGGVLRREEMGTQGTRMGTRWNSSLPGGKGAPGEGALLASLRVAAERFRPELFEFFRWPQAQILQDSPLQVAQRDGEEQFRPWLKLWPACSTVWIGDVYSSGKPEHRTHFRPVAEWYRIGPVMGNFTCGSAFKPGSYQRSNANLEGHRFLVVESDTLSRDEVGAVFAYLQRRLHYRLHCIIDTAGKSLHGWFEAPKNKLVERRLQAGLEVFGCDPKVFTYSQPVRAPGAFREGKLQRLIWLRE